jgi:hypothetical protein
MEHQHNAGRKKVLENIRRIFLLCKKSRTFLLFSVRAFNPRSCHPRLTLGLASLCCHIKEQREELRSGHPVQYWNNMSHGQNLSSASGKLEFVALSNSLKFPPLEMY